MDRRRRGRLQMEAQDDGQDRQQWQNQAVETCRRPAGFDPHDQHTVAAKAEGGDEQPLAQPPAVRPQRQQAHWVEQAKEQNGDQDLGKDNDATVRFCCM